MKALTALLIGSVLAAASTGAISQSQKSGSGSNVGSTASTGSSDAFTECRDEVAKAREAYQAKKISKEEYEKQRKAAQAKLKASGQRGMAEKNLECQ